MRSLQEVMEYAQSFGTASARGSLLLTALRFLWTSSILGQLADATTPQEISQMLQSRLQSLCDMYIQCLHRIDVHVESDAKLGRRFLHELLSAHRPVRAETLLNAVAQDAGWDNANDQDQMKERILYTSGVVGTWWFSVKNDFSSRMSSRPMAFLTRSFDGIYRG